MNSLAETRNESESTLQVGQILDGKYRVASLIGQGGMAAVWAGINERTGKRVALKVLLPSLTNTPGAEALFQREVLAASRVNHPNVVTVFDVIEHQGLTCIVMELLSGEPMGTYLARRGALSINEALGLLLPAMRGVSAAHAQGVIHRDLKPQNIFICIGPDSKAVTSKVLDFGISVVVGGPRDTSTSEAPPIMMGTPAYMAPEQIAGGAQVDERADVYGLGALLYEALAGQAPFPGEPGADLYERILDEGPPPLGSLRSDLSPTLVRIIEAAMAKDPERRLASVDTMVNLLEAELLPATPLPRVPTPAAGTLALAASDVTAGHGATPVPALLKHEPSEEHQAATLFLVNFPLDAETPRQDASPENPDRQDFLPGHPWSDETEAPEAWTADGMTGIARPVHHRAWRALAAVAIAGLVSGTAFVLWTLAGGDSQTTTGTYPLAVTTSRPRAGASAAQATAPLLGVVAPVTSAPPLSAPVPTAGALEPDTTIGRQTAVNTTPAISRQAARGTSRSAPEGRTTSHREPSLASALARAGTVGPAKARAGTLSAEDF